MKFFKLTFFFVFFALFANAQLVVDNTITVEELVNNVLLGDGVEATNITFNGQDASTVNVQIGFFESQGSNIPIDSGLVMATGNVIVAEGPNDEDSASEPTVFPSPEVDPDIESIISPFLVNDIAILEFDFTVNSESVEFRYVFASEEYDEFVCSDFNDAFGFFLSGTDINGPFEDGAINIALIPDTDIPVAINTVNSGMVGSSGTRARCEASSPDWDQNSQYYISYDIQTGEFDSEDGDTQFDGFTTVLTAGADIVCGGEYHIKMVIADAGDSSYDSGVFLEAGSFQATGEIFGSFSPVFASDSTDVTQPGYDSLAVGGCTNPIIRLDRSPCACYNSIEYSFSDEGDAVLGEDFITVGEFPPPGLDEEGVEFIQVEIAAIDTFATDTLNVIFVVDYETCDGLTGQTEIEIPIVPAPEIILETNSPVEFFCPDDELDVLVEASNGILEYIYEWEDFGGDGDLFLDENSYDVDPPSEEEGFQRYYRVRVRDNCNFKESIDSVLVINSIPPQAEMVLNPFQQPDCPNEPVTISVDVTSDENNDNTIVWTNSAEGQFGFGEEATLADINQAVQGFFPSVTVDINLIDQCGRMSDLTTVVNYPERDSLVANFTPITDNCPKGSVLLESVVTGGAGDYSYNWGIEGESTFTDGFDSSIPTTFIDAGPGENTITLFVQDKCNRLGFDIITDVQGSELGFLGSDDAEQTLPFINLDVIPNIITPNGDGRNEVFVVPGIDAFEDASVLIYDRWGKLIYENNSYDAGTGEATSSQGFSAEGLEDGTYFYIINIDSGECVEQGDLQVVGTND
ncbi:MAG: gliding motility-associated C-terminal domain-containing protein [Flavobacteriales bacterium]|nr:gliding motility-associated C-terminal domain-containing protein [Flavobacteriales bacterium]